MRIRNFPELSEVIVDPNEKQVIVTPELSRAMPGVVEAFDAVDQVFSDDPEGHLKTLEESLF